MTTPAESEVSKLFPQPVTVTLKGEQIEIKPFGFGQFPKVAQHLRSMKFDGIAVAKTAIAAPADSAELPPDLVSPADKAADIVALIADNAEPILQMAALATRKPRDFFDDVPMDEGAALVVAIVQVNMDFFVNRLQPVMVGAIGKFGQSLGQKL